MAQYNHAVDTSALQRVNRHRRDCQSDRVGSVCVRLKTISHVVIIYAYEYSFNFSVRTQYTTINYI